MFITFEGGEGAGKTTQIHMLSSRLKAEGFSVLTTREPGGEAQAEILRELLVTGDPDRWEQDAELLLFLAARVQHVRRVIQPAIASGHIVLCDRFSDSTIVYQGIARGVTFEDSHARYTCLHDAVLLGCQPDLTFVLDIAPEIGLARASARDASRSARFEQMGTDFHARVREGFLALAAANASRFCVLDATLPVEALGDMVYDALSRHSSWPPTR